MTRRPLPSDINPTIAALLEPRPEPSVPPHVHRWLPAGIIHSGTMLVQSCECGVVRTVKVPG